MKLIITYLILVNAAAFAAYGIDKWKAQHNRWRISEAALLGLALFGGAAGAYAGMRAFRHKTKHAKFTIGVPAILVIQAAAAAYFLTQNGGLA